MVSTIRSSSRRSIGSWEPHSATSTSWSWVNTCRNTYQVTWYYARPRPISRSLRLQSPAIKVRHPHKGCTRYARVLIMWCRNCSHSWIGPRSYKKIPIHRGPCWCTLLIWCSHNPTPKWTKCSRSSSTNQALHSPMWSVRTHPRSRRSSNWTWMASRIQRLMRSRSVIFWMIFWILLAVSYGSNLIYRGINDKHN